MRRRTLALFTILTLLLNFTILNGQNGPAGVGTQATNPLWLKANDITGISSGSPINVNWTDASGNNHHASQSTVSYQPAFIDNAVNGYPVVRFDGADDLFHDVHSYNANTVFIVYNVSSTLQSSTQLGQPWGYYSDGAHVAMDARGGGNLQGFSFDGTPLNVTQAIYGIDGSAYIGPVSNSNTLAWQYDNFEIVAVEFTAPKAMTNQVLGSLYSGSFPVGTHQFGGDIAEIIVYNNAINNAARIVVENYLSSKYGIDISGNSIDFYSNESTHPYGVTGIGQIGGAAHSAAYSDKIIQLNNPSDLNNDEYLFTGHDGQGITSWTTTEIPSGVESIQRLGREWILEETGDIG
ncbi:MAG: hypothetical protein K8R53_03700, partial [Bacteroidales bacterium]|nr:hypothetical protein [Bacteroidales bacterium]